MSQHNELATKLQGRIAKVSMRRFRGLRQIEALELPQLTVLIGANGADKSTLIRFFEMLGWMLKAQCLQEFVLRYGGGDEQFFMGARQTPLISFGDPVKKKDEYAPPPPPLHRPHQAD